MHDSLAGIELMLDRERHVLVAGQIIESRDRQARTSLESSAGQAGSMYAASTLPAPSNVKPSMSPTR